MSEASVKHRAEMKAKAHRLADQKEGRVDASGYEIPGKPTSSGQHYAKVKENLTTPCDGKPANPREFKRGGLATGGKANHHGGRRSRDMGGAMPPQAAPAPGMNVPVNRFDLSPVPNKMGQAIQSATGIKKGGKVEHRKDGGGNWIAGAVKHKGALHKELGVPEGKKIPEKKLEKAEHSKNPLERKRANLAETLKGLHKADGGSVSDGTIEGTRPVKGGRFARKDGGRTKGKTNIAIIIGGGGQQHPDVPPASMTQGPARPPIPPPQPPMAPPGMGAPPQMPPGGGAPPPSGMPPQMPMRASGGRLIKPGKYPIDSGGGGGEARLEKARKYGL